MASRYPASWLDELRSRSDIVQIVSGYVALTKKGRNYWGLCPFHGEKTASFSVDGEHQLYYCFGCKAGGDVIHFIMDMERLSFPEAVEQLADRAHMTLPEMEKDEDYERRRTQRERLLNANREAARFYHETLFTPAGEAALAYLRRRGLSDGVIRKFGLGASPDSWSSLSDRLLEKGWKLDELVLAGLTVKKKKEDGRERYFDMFRNRAMFPIINTHGNVIAFGGRTLEKREPKYLNTSDTPVFNKRQGVYAANLLRQQRHLERVILVEGYMDVVSLTQYGVEGVCATLGTALTNEQARLLHRFAPQVYLGYDGDSAGQHAILRGLEILEQEGVPARVLDFPDGLDPDEFIRRDGIEGFRKLPAISPAAYRLRRLKEQFDLSGQDGKLSYARAASDIIAAVDPVEREVHLKDLSLATGFTRETLLEQMNLSAARQPVGKAPAAQPARHHAAPAEPGSDDLKAQELLLSLFASGQIPKEMIDEKDFEDDELKSLYRELWAGASPASLPDLAPDDATRSRFTRILLSPSAGDKDQMITMANDCLNRIRKTRLEKRFEELSRMLDTAPDDTLPALLKEAQVISDKLKKLK
ncbi:MAG: DNA primase [Clostridia bacterium]|nr:DNA primase [Clostridia bacterium]